MLYSPAAVVYSMLPRNKICDIKLIDAMFTGSQVAASHKLDLETGKIAIDKWIGASYNARACGRFSRTRFEPCSSPYLTP